jgi:hypothetical protein
MIICSSDGTSFVYFLLTAGISLKSSKEKLGNVILQRSKRSALLINSMMIV